MDKIVDPINGLTDDKILTEFTSITRIEEAEKLLKQLQKSIEVLVNYDRNSFMEGELGKSLLQFEDACKYSAQRLAHPSFRIATIGTTSSGKSTLVNAMIGRRLAPMEADEMSAGILTFAHAERSRFTVEPTQNAKWAVEDCFDLEDEDIYLKLRATKEANGYDGVMVAYHEAKKKNPELEAPRVRVEAPILPMLWPRLLALPNGIEFELLDLPGLKSINDRHNLEIIQDRVKEAFSLVILDYTQTDNKNRRTLFEELKKIVEAMSGKTEAMLFVFNKVNLRNREDVALEERLQKLRGEIAQQLELATLPEVLPIDALLLYNVQCAWGPGLVPNAIERRRDFLEGLLEDCAKTMSQQKKSDLEFKQWFNQYEDSIHTLETKEFKRLLKWSHQWSYGEKLWMTLKERVAVNFPELVVFPAIAKTIFAFDDLAPKIAEVSKIRQLQTRHQVEGERQRINRQLAKIRAYVESRKQEFQKKLQGALQEFKKNSPEATNQAINLLGNLPGFQSLVQAIEEVRGDLLHNIIVPVRDCFKQGTLFSDLSEQLQSFLPVARVNGLVKSCENYARNFMTPEIAKQGLKMEAKDSDSSGKERQVGASQRCQAVYQRMREALSHRAEFALQMKAKVLEKAVIDLLYNETQEVLKLAKEVLGSDQQLKAVLPSFESLMQSTVIQIPQELFKLPEPIKQQKDWRTEYAGREYKGQEAYNESYTYTTGTCFTENHTGYRTKYRDKYEDKYVEISWHVLQLPSADGMAEQWEDGIKQARSHLWGTLIQWIQQAFGEVIGQQSTSLVQAGNFFEQEFDKQLRILEETGQAEISKWRQVAKQLESANGIYQQLVVQAQTVEKGGLE